MTTMVIAAICPKCSEIRARSRFTFQRGDPLKSPLTGSDFEPVGEQPQPEDGQPSTCYACGTSMSLRPIPVQTANGQPAPADTTPLAPAGVETLFAVQPGEELKSIRELGQDAIVVITNRRVLKISLVELAGGA